MIKNRIVYDKILFNEEISYKTNDYFKNINNVLICDDAIYSGHNICSIIDDFLYYDYDRKYYRGNINFDIIVPYYTIHGLQEIMRFTQSINVNNKLNLVSNELLICLGDIFDLPIDNKIIDYFCIEGNPSLCYFDHKIANKFGSIPSIFTKIIKNQPSRKIIEDIINKYDNL